MMPNDFLGPLSEKLDELFNKEKVTQEDMEELFETLLPNVIDDNTQNNNVIHVLLRIAEKLQAKPRLKNSTPDTIQVYDKTSGLTGNKTIKLNEYAKNQYRAMRVVNDKHNARRNVILNKILDHERLSWFLTAASAQVEVPARHHDDFSSFHARFERCIELLRDLRAKKNSQGIRQVNEDFKEIVVNYPKAASTLANYIPRLHVDDGRSYECVVFIESTSSDPNTSIAGYEPQSGLTKLGVREDLTRTASMIDASIAANDVGDYADLPHPLNRAQKTMYVDKRYPEETIRDIAVTLVNDGRQIKPILDKLLKKQMSVNNFTIFLQRLQPHIENNLSEKTTLLETINTSLSPEPLKRRDSLSDLSVARENNQIRQENKRKARVLRQFVRNLELMWWLGVDAESIKNLDQINNIISQKSSALVQMRGLANDNGVRAWNECLKYLKRHRHSSVNDSSLIDALIGSARSNVYTPWTKTQRELLMEKVSQEVSAAVFPCGSSRRTAKYIAASLAENNKLNALEMPVDLKRQMTATTCRQAAKFLVCPARKPVEKYPTPVYSQRQKNASL